MKSLFVILDNSESDISSIVAALDIANDNSSNVHLINYTEGEYIKEKRFVIDGNTSEEECKKYIKTLDDISQYSFGLAINTLKKSGFEDSRIIWHQICDKTLRLCPENFIPDLLIMSHTLGEDKVDNNEYIAKKLVSTSIPIYLVPDVLPKTLNRRVTIAWDGSLNVSRSISLSHSFIERADEVEVITVDNNDDSFVLPLKKYLDDYGIKFTHAKLTSGKFSIGELLLGEVTNKKSDLLIMGGFSKSIMREKMLGGVSKYMLDHSFCPIFISHTS